MCFGGLSGGKVVEGSSEGEGGLVPSTGEAVDPGCFAWLVRRGELAEGGVAEVIEEKGGGGGFLNLKDGEPGCHP